MPADLLTVDADGHVLEPADTWERYIDPDYPHLDASFGVVKELRARLASLPLASQRKVLGENVLRFYGLGRWSPSAAHAAGR